MVHPIILLILLSIPSKYTSFLKPNYILNIHSKVLYSNPRKNHPAIHTHHHLKDHQYIYLYILIIILIILKSPNNNSKVLLSKSKTIKVTASNIYSNLCVLNSILILKINSKLTKIKHPKLISFLIDSPILNNNNYKILIILIYIYSVIILFHYFFVSLEYIYVCNHYINIQLNTLFLHKIFSIHFIYIYICKGETYYLFFNYTYIYYIYT